MRLQSAIDQADALDAIREIARNLIGTEEVAVFKVDKKRSELWFIGRSGVDPNKHSALEVHREPRLKQVLSGKTVFRLKLSSGKLAFHGRSRECADSRSCGGLAMRSDSVVSLVPPQGGNGTR